YSITRNMSSQLSSYLQAEENTSMGLDLIQTQSSTLDTIQNLTTRLRALAEQAHNGTYGAQSLQAINQEAEAIVQEIDRISKNAEYNGIKLFDNSAASLEGLPKLNQNGFIKEIVERDTSSMTKLSSVSSTATLSSGTYSVSTTEELIQLMQMADNGKITSKTVEFVLASDIDLSDCNLASSNGTFTGILDGNGHTISNLDGRSLFGRLKEATIKNLKITNCNVQGNGKNGILAKSSTDKISVENCSISGNVSGSTDAGLLVGYINCTTPCTMFDSCYVSGNVKGGENVGGIAGYVFNDKIGIKNCISEVNVVAEDGSAGGFVGYAVNTQFSNCIASGNIKGTDYSGGITGLYDNQMGSTIIEKVLFTGTVESNKGAGAIIGSYLDEHVGSQASISGFYDTSLNGEISAFADKTSNSSSTFNIIDAASQLQVGIDASKDSNIKFTTNLSLSMNRLKLTGLTNKNSLENIDELINQISSHQTKLGAQENRLTSALESINVKI
ncbi:hypothetical protein IJ750_07090, partial [bacterium]|nr:hypothetical protein [bacterium]